MSVHGVLNLTGATPEFLGPVETNGNLEFILTVYAQRSSFFVWDKGHTGAGHSINQEEWM